MSDGKTTKITDSADEAAAYIRSGGIVAFPTETVFGLGADVFDEAAVKRIFEAKQRPADNPLIAHISDRKQIPELAAEVSETARALMDSFFPGPLTVVLRKSERVPETATAGLDTIAIRMPDEPLTARFLESCGTPVAAPSANLSGRPSPTTWEAVEEDLGGRIDCILKGAPSRIGVESTVVDCVSDPPVLLRKGAVSYEDLKRVVPAIVLAGQSGQERPRSPGLRHRHYKPRGKVLIRDSGSLPEDESSSAFIGVSEPAAKFALSKVCRNNNEYAGALYDFLRECDRMGLTTVHCEPVSESGIGATIMDRLRRASE